MDSPRPARTTLLALVYALGGVLCAVGVVVPQSPDSPVRLLATLAVVAPVIAALLWGARDRAATGAAHAGAVVLALLVALVASQSATAAGVVAIGPVLVALGLYAAHFWRPAVARAHVALLLATTTAGAMLAVPSGWQLGWLSAVVTTVGVAEAQARLGRQLRHAATTDPLTGLLNRRAWHEGASRGLAREARAGTPFTVALLDLDDFKAVNDALGHAAGDALLCALARSWSALLREADLLGRHGGDEFVLSLPGTDRDAADVLLARLSESHTALWSVGTATSEPGEPLDDLLARADDDLYRRKDTRPSATDRGAAGVVVAPAG